MSTADVETEVVFGVDLHVGRLLYDTRLQRFCAVKDVDRDTLEVTVALLSEVPHGGVLDVEADTDTEDGRPDDCDCGRWNEGVIACWPCFRDGFETPATDHED